jgi:hypothetical protein
MQQQYFINVLVYLVILNLPSLTSPTLLVTATTLVNEVAVDELLADPALKIHPRQKAQAGTIHKYAQYEVS